MHSLPLHLSSNTLVAKGMDGIANNAPALTYTHTPSSNVSRQNLQVPNPAPGTESLH